MSATATATTIDEVRRLEVLRALRILDTDPETTFDRLAELAAETFDAPIALVSLVDEHREWFKARCGVETTEGPRHTAFCAHTIESDEVLVVEDAASDERFRGFPAVVGEPGIRFYAGAPLRLASGLNVGALCIKDYRPRRFSVVQKSMLRNMAALVVSEMEHRLVEGALRRWEHVFRCADWGIAVAEGMGSTLDIINESFARMHGYTVEELRGRPIADVFAPECRAEVRKHALIARDRGHHVYESLHQRQDGSVFPVQVDVTVSKDERGRVAYRAAHVQDITARKAAEQALHDSEQRSRERLAELEHLYATAPVGLALADADLRILRTNEQLAAFSGFSGSEHIGRSLREVLPAVAEVVEPLLKQAVDSGEPVLDVEVATRTPSRTEFVGLVSFYPLKWPDGTVRAVSTVVHDISERKKSEIALRGSEQRYRRLYAVVKTQQETSLDGIVVVDNDGAILSSNSRFAAMWNLPPEVLAAGLDAAALEYAKDQLVDPDGFLARVGELYARPDESSFDTLELRDGRVFERYSTPMTGPDDGLLGRVWFFRDITERTRAEHALRESRERLSGTVESALDAIITVDEHRTIELFNASAENVFRCSAKQATGTPLDRLASPALLDWLQQCMEACRKEDRKRWFTWLPAGMDAVRADGERFPIEATVSQTLLAGRRLFTIILRDVNERHRAEAELRSLRRENIFLREQADADADFENIVGKSPAIREVQAGIEQVAETDCTVLITGETGTGKELIARAIHQRSPRRSHLLVKVNCAALPGGLIESELFGHEKGAFTGALTAKIGRFEMADGGTIFLDEIGDLPIELQAKLLRVLQEGEFERVGGTETRQVDVRIIAATHRDLARASQERSFRSDLYYRINVFPIRAPALRERREDIPLLAHHFAMIYSTKMGRRIESIPGRVLDALCHYDWPGNVRELQNVIERATIISPGPDLELGPWPPASVRSEPTAVGQTLEVLQREHILKTLEHCGWRVSGPRGAARLLGLKPTTLEARMKRMGICRPA